MDGTTVLGDYTAGTWTNKDVRVSFSCADALSGVNTTTSNIAGHTVTGSGEDQSVSSTGSCVDQAGNTATGASFSNIDIDKDKPVISSSAKTQPDGLNYTAGTWTNKDVQVSFSCADTLSGTDTNTVAGATKSASGADQSVTNTGTYTDQAGNTADSATFSNIDIDKDAPTGVTFQGGGLSDNASYDFGSVPAGPTGCTATDALSGFKSCGTDAATTYKTTVGTHTITATALDNAGNTATKTLTYTVRSWTMTGFYQPVDMLDGNGDPVVNTVKGGSTVPIKFELFQGPSTSLTELTATANIVQPLKYQKISCSSLANEPEDPIETLASGGTSLRYDTTGGQFIYNWKLPTGTGTCYSVTISSLDGSYKTAYFKLK